MTPTTESAKTMEPPKTSRVEITFPFPVNLPKGWEQRLDSLVGEVCDAYEGAHPDRVMWPAGFGAAPQWSKRDAAFLGVQADPNAPDSGEPTFDDTVFQISVAEREAYPEEIARRNKRNTRARSGSAPAQPGAGLGEYRNPFAWLVESQKGWILHVRNEIASEDFWRACNNKGSIPLYRDTAEDHPAFATPSPSAERAPVAWRYRRHGFAEARWNLRDYEPTPDGGFDIEPLYAATPPDAGTAAPVGDYLEVKCPHCDARMSIIRGEHARVDLLERPITSRAPGEK